MAGTQGTAQAQLAEISSDSCPSSFFMGSSHPGVFSARVLALLVFCPLQTAGSQAPPISFLLSSNVSVSMKPVLSKYLTWQTYPLPVSFLGHSHQLAGWLVRLWLLSVFCGSASSKRASFEFLPSLRAPQSLEWCLPHSRCSTGIC